MSKTPQHRVKTAVLISGGGSNMQALAEAAQNPNYPAQIDLVISNISGAGGIERANALGIQAFTLDHKAFETRENFERALDAILKQAGIELVCCAGFMRVLTPWLTSRWEDRMINIHPSLLPKYKGLNTHSRAIEAGDSEHGASVHYVTAELDGGAIIAQAHVKVAANDTPESLSEKVLKKEHPLFVSALSAVARKIQKDRCNR